MLPRHSTSATGNRESGSSPRSSWSRTSRTQGSDTVATSHDTAANALVAGTVVGLTLTGTAGSAAVFGETDSVKVVATETGTKTFNVDLVATFEKYRA